MTYKPVILETSGWMTDWPHLPGLHRCQRSMCDVRHGHTSDTRTHTRLFSITDASTEKANANGAIMVVVAMESRLSIGEKQAEDIRIKPPNSRHSPIFRTWRRTLDFRKGFPWEMEKEYSMQSILWALLVSSRMGSSS